MGLIISALVTFITSLSSYFNFEKYWMRNISIHIRLNVMRDEFIFHALSGTLDKEKLIHYENELKEIQQDNISYWEKAISKI